jgi:hypothetical protein
MGPNRRPSQHLCQGMKSRFDCWLLVAGVSAWVYRQWVDDFNLTGMRGGWAGREVGAGGGAANSGATRSERWLPVAPGGVDSQRCPLRGPHRAPRLPRNAAGGGIIHIKMEQNSARGASVARPSGVRSS